MNSVKILLMTASMAVLVSCGTSSGKEDNNTVKEKKARLETLKKQQGSINDEITKLEKEIAKLDPAAAKAEKAKLVGLTTIAPESFTHFIDLQGKITAENVAYVTPQNQGGQVKEIYVKQGDYVTKGKLLMKLDDQATRAQLGPLEVQLANAQDLLRRRQNLWAQGIGTEVDLTAAKTTAANFQKQIDALNVQLGQYNVYAPMSGVAEIVTIKVGEFFSAASAVGDKGMGIMIVNTSDLKATANVPENYLGKVKEGSNVAVALPDINKTINARVTVSGKIIDPSSRSFYIEAKLPADRDLKPNQVALVKIQDYHTPSAIVVPVNTLQTDDKGKFVMVTAKENGKTVARKRQVTEGQMYGDKVEIKSGLQTGDQIISEGFQGLYDGQLITTEAK